MQYREPPRRIRPDGTVEVLTELPAPNGELVKQWLPLPPVPPPPAVEPVSDMPPDGIVAGPPLPEQLLRAAYSKGEGVYPTWASQQDLVAFYRRELPARDWQENQPELGATLSFYAGSIYGGGVMRLRIFVQPDRRWSWVRFSRDDLIPPYPVHAPRRKRLWWWK